MRSSRAWFLGFITSLLGSVLVACPQRREAPAQSGSPAVPLAPTFSAGTGGTSVDAHAVSVTPAGSALPASALPTSALPTKEDARLEAPADAVVALANTRAAPSNALGTEPQSSKDSGRTGEGAPSLQDAQGKPLPQTDQRPALDSAFQGRMALLGQAIISGEAEPAFAAFFPLIAYQQVKDVAKPERDYKFRLLANFKRDVLEYHRALGLGAATSDAKFEAVSVPEHDAKWMPPGSEGNKLGYFRVLRSRLRFTLPKGRTRDLELTSMISWRGEWYVVHLHGFK